MFKKILIIILLITSYELLVTNCNAQDETLTITTYYPSPYGVYREMRAQRMAIGDTYMNHSVVCWEGDTDCSGSAMIPSANDVDLIVQGKVGIGTTSVPTYNKLQVDGGWLLVRFSGSTSWGDASARIGVHKTDNTANVGPWHMSQNNDGKFAIHQNGVGDRLTIDSNGNVGIGTTNPGTRLHVMAANATDAQLRLGQNNVPTDGWEFLANQATGNLNIGRFGGAATPNVLTLQMTSGNVGIGTASPQAKLHVGGTAGRDGIMFPDGTLQTTAANVRVGQGSVANGNNFNVQCGGSGTVLLSLKFDFTALYGDFGWMTANLRSQGGGSILKTRRGINFEWDNRRSSSHVQIFYTSTGNSPGQTLTFNAYTPDGTHLINDPDYWYIGI